MKKLPVREFTKLGKHIVEVLLEKKDEQSFKFLCRKLDINPRKFLEVFGSKEV